MNRAKLANLKKKEHGFLWGWYVPSLLDPSVLVSDITRKQEE